MRGWQQVPSPQELVLHCTPASQAEPVGTTHRLPWQLPSQQSSFWLHVSPSGTQGPHWLVVPRHRSVPQQPPAYVQLVPVTRQHRGLPPSGWPWQPLAVQQSLTSAHLHPVYWQALGWHVPSRQMRFW